MQQSTSASEANYRQAECRCGKTQVRSELRHTASVKATKQSLWDINLLTPNEQVQKFESKLGFLCQLSGHTVVKNLISPQ